jgi:hypothetical protein
MEIIIGAAMPFKKVSVKKEKKKRLARIVEAKLVSSRSPRRKRGALATEFIERRDSDELVDPIGSRILTLMVSEVYAMPMDFDTDSYRIFLRFAPK